ncbi:MAG: peptide chain release factor N(5)-glutamine methyltransferase, partial [Ruminiclostridium sp.]|nr:peptide chain release factor N(5)-glutamine methyltransferase [Ruminiclostridium sp.]
EPELALFGGKDGLDFYRVIFEKWKPLLKPKGIFAVEVGDCQGETVERIMTAAGFEVQVFKDYGGIPRVVLGEKR